WVPLTAAILGRLLEGTNRGYLKELSLPGCGLSEQHAWVLAGSAGVKDLHSLDLSANWGFGGAAAQVLFTSGHLRSLVHLDLSRTQFGPEGALALAAAPGWDRLRSLDLAGTGPGTRGLRALLASPNLRRLTQLSAGVSYSRGEPSLEVFPDMAE